MSPDFSFTVLGFVMTESFVELFPSLAAATSLPNLGEVPSLYSNLPNELQVHNKSKAVLCRQNFKKSRTRFVGRTEAPDCTKETGPCLERYIHFFVKNIARRSKTFSATPHSTVVDLKR